MSASVQMASQHVSSAIARGGVEAPLIAPFEVIQAWQMAFEHSHVTPEHSVNASGSGSPRPAEPAAEAFNRAVHLSGKVMRSSMERPGLVPDQAKGLAGTASMLQRGAACVDPGVSGAGGAAGEFVNGAGAPPAGIAQSPLHRRSGGGVADELPGARASEHITSAPPAAMHETPATVVCVFVSGAGVSITVRDARLGADEALQTAFEAASHLTGSRSDLRQLKLNGRVVYGGQQGDLSALSSRADYFVSFAA